MRLPHQRGAGCPFVVEFRDGGAGSDGHQSSLVYPQAMNAKPMSLHSRDGETIKRSRIELTHPTRPPSCTRRFGENAEPSIWFGVEEEGAPDTVLPAAIPDPATDPFHFQR
jgi:hypothetical protein